MQVITSCLSNFSCHFHCRCYLSLPARALSGTAIEFPMHIWVLEKKWAWNPKEAYHPPFEIKYHISNPILRGKPPTFGSGEFSNSGIQKHLLAMCSLYQLFNYHNKLDVELLHLNIHDAEVQDFRFSYSLNW